MHRGDKGPKIMEDPSWTFPRGQIVVARVKDYDWRLVRNYDAIRKLHDIAYL